MVKHPMNKKERNDIEKHKIKKLAEDTSYWCGAGAYFDDYKNRYIRYWYRKKWLKRVAAKATRKMKDVTNGSLYKKAFDLWWELF